MKYTTFLQEIVSTWLNIKKVSKGKQLGPCANKFHDFHLLRSPSCCFDIFDPRDGHIIIIIIIIIIAQSSEYFFKG